MREGGYVLALTVTVNDAVAGFALPSVASHVTLVLPILKRLPDLGVHPTGTAPSLSSCAVTVKRTRAVLAPLAALTVLLVAPLKVGRIASNSSPGTSIVPVQVSGP